MKSTYTLLAIFFLIAIIVAIWLYPRLPMRVPTHWDMHGGINGYTPRLLAAAIPALLVLGLALLTVCLPLGSARKFEIKPFQRVYGILMLAVQGAILVTSLSVLLKTCGYALPMPAMVMLAVGVLVMVIDNYTGKLRKKFFVGIRTPWTLDRDAVWQRTHRFAGGLFMLAGLAVAVGVCSLVQRPGSWSCRWQRR